MSVASVAGDRSSVGMGRPSDGGSSQQQHPHPTLTGSLSLSSSFSASGSNGVLSPLPLAKAEYSAAAHSFIQRDPIKSLSQLEEARRLLFEVIQIGDDVRLGRHWTSLREKVLILWITLLVSLWKRDAEVQNLDEAMLRSIPTTTQEIFGQSGSTQSQNFLARLVKEVTTPWASTAAEAETLRSSSPTLDLSSEEAHIVQRRVMGRISASVAASLVMASLSVEEASQSRSSQERQQGEAVPLPNSVPITRNLAETLLSSNTSTIDGLDVQKDSKETMAAYAKVLELYTIHVLGVRCGQWDYADQVVRLSLLQDEARADLLRSLSRAQNHVATRPERRASAALAEKRAYELEKQRRASDLRDKAAAEAVLADSATNEPSYNSGKSRRSRPQASSRNGKRRVDDGYLSTSGAESSHASAPESDADSPTDQRSDPIGNAQVQSPNNVTGFAATRRHLSETLAKNRQRDSAAHEVGSGTEAQSIPRDLSGQEQKASSRQQVSSVTAWRALLARLKAMNLPMVLSILAPLIVLVMSLQRLTLSRQRGSGRGQTGGRAGGPGIAGREAEGSLARRAVNRLWSTVRMGTQVTYL